MHTSLRLSAFVSTLLLLISSAGVLAEGPRSLFEERLDKKNLRAQLAMQQGDFAIAYCIWEPLAREGNAEAQYHIGWMYHNGYGLAIDDEKALKWWFAAARQGFAEADYALGDLYANGNGVEKNSALALGWYTSAILKNHDTAHEILLELVRQRDSLALNIFQQLMQEDIKPLVAPSHVRSTKANTREGPNKKFPVVKVLQKGDSVWPLYEDGNWTFIGLPEDGLTAWIFSSLLETTETN